MNKGNTANNSRTSQSKRGSSSSQQSKSTVRKNSQLQENDYKSKKANEFMPSPMAAAGVRFSSSTDPASVRFLSKQRRPSSQGARKAPRKDETETGPLTKMAETDTGRFKAVTYGPAALNTKNVKAKITVLEPKPQCIKPKVEAATCKPARKSRFKAVTYGPKDVDNCGSVKARFTVLEPNLDSCAYENEAKINGNVQEVPECVPELCVPQAAACKSPEPDNGATQDSCIEPPPVQTACDEKITVAITEPECMPKTAETCTNRFKAVTYGPKAVDKCGKIKAKITVLESSMECKKGGSPVCVPAPDPCPATPKADKCTAPPACTPVVVEAWGLCKTGQTDTGRFKAVTYGPASLNCKGDIKAKITVLEPPTKCVPKKECQVDKRCSRQNVRKAPCRPIVMEATAMCKKEQKDTGRFKAVTYGPTGLNCKGDIKAKITVLEPSTECKGASPPVCVPETNECVPVTEMCANPIPDKCNDPPVCSVPCEVILGDAEAMCKTGQADTGRFKAVTYGPTSLTCKGDIRAKITVLEPPTKNNCVNGNDPKSAVIDCVPKKECQVEKRCSRQNVRKATCEPIIMEAEGMCKKGQTETGRFKAVTYGPAALTKNGSIRAKFTVLEPPTKCTKSSPLKVVENGNNECVPKPKECVPKICNTGESINQGTDKQCARRSSKTSDKCTGRFKAVTYGPTDVTCKGDIKAKITVLEPKPKDTNECVPKQKQVENCESKARKSRFKAVTYGPTAVNKDGNVKANITVLEPSCKNKIPP